MARPLVVFVTMWLLMAVAVGGGHDGGSGHDRGGGGSGDGPMPTVVMMWPLTTHSPSPLWGHVPCSHAILFAHT